MFVRVLRTPFCTKRWRSFSGLSYVHHVGEEPLRALTLGKLVESTAKRFPDREVFVGRQQGKRLTYLQLLEEADRLAAGLLGLGLRKGDRLGLWAPNLVEWHVVNVACARVGLVVVAINPAYQAPEMEYCINKVGVKAIVCPDKIKRVDYYRILTQIAPELRESHPGRLRAARAPTLQSVVVIARENLRGTFNYNSILSASEEDVERVKKSQDSVQPDDVLNIQFTSGTTGRPKAVMVSHFNVVNNSFYVGKRNELHLKHHKICVQVPFFHAFGYNNTFVAAINHGATMVLPSLTYNADENLTAIKEERCSLIVGTPTMYVDLVNIQSQRREDIAPEIAVSGGSPCSPELFKQMREVLKVGKVKSVYGATETTAVIFQSLPVDEDQHQATATVGHVQEHLEAKVVDENGHMVALGTPGELWVRGYCNMLGYWGDEAKTKETIGRDRWLKTGDQFVLQEDGYGRIVGRLKDMIIRGGENIYPKEIEDYLNTHPDVLEVQVIGLSHERLGEEVCACVRLRQGSSVTLEDLIEFCKGEMAHFKIPSQLRVVEDFPKTQSGKIQKHLLRERFERHGSAGVPIKVLRP